MKPILKVLNSVLSFAAAVRLEAQVAPEATSGHTIPINGIVSYAVRYSQSGNYYPGGNGGQMAVVSGDFTYATNSERKPFSIVFGGGDNWVLTGTPYNSGPYENLLLSQGLAGEHWSIQLSDNVSYLTGAPIDGFAGVPGTGEPISQPNPPTDQTVVTINDSVVNNMANAGYSYKLNGFSTVNFSGGYSLLRYTGGGAGIDNNGVMANMGWTQRFSARNTVIGQYAFGHFTYPGSDASFLYEYADVSMAAYVDADDHFEGFRRAPVSDLVGGGRGGERHDRERLGDGHPGEFFNRSFDQHIDCRQNPNRRSKRGL